MDRLIAGRLTGVMTKTTPSSTSAPNAPGGAQPTLVFGGTGKTGRRIVARLGAAGVPVRIGSRSAAVPFSWDDRRTWEPVLAGTGALYVAFAPDLAVPGAAETVRSLVALAIDAAPTRRVVLLSGRGEPEAQRAEEAVRAVAPATTVIRASWFSQNFSEDFLVDGVLRGEIVLPAGEVAEPFVDADDLADIAFEALTGDTHAGRLYEVTGPRLLTFAQVAAELSEATGRTITYVPVTLEEYVATAREQGVPEALVGAFTHLFAEVLDGRNASLTNGIERALGRPPRDFAAYARATAAAGCWSADAAGVTR